MSLEFGSCRDWRETNDLEKTNSEVKEAFKEIEKSLIRLGDEKEISEDVQNIKNDVEILKRSFVDAKTLKEKEECLISALNAEKQLMLMEADMRNRKLGLNFVDYPTVHGEIKKMETSSSSDKNINQQQSTKAEEETTVQSNIDLSNCFIKGDIIVAKENTDINITIKNKR